MPDAQLLRPVVVYTCCAEVTRKAMVALRSECPVALAASEEALHVRVASGTRLVVLHLARGAADAGTPRRLLHAVRDASLRMIALTDTGTPTPGGLVVPSLVKDVLCTRSERWPTLLRAWALRPARARQLVVELRLLHRAAPLALVPILDRLMLAPESTLSVKSWSAAAGMHRTSLYREVLSRGIRPSDLIDVVRALHAVGSCLVTPDGRYAGSQDWPNRRSDRRLLERTFGMNSHELADAGAPGEPERNHLIAERLRGFFDRARVKSERGRTEQASDEAFII